MKFWIYILILFQSKCLTWKNIKIYEFTVFIWLKLHRRKNIGNIIKQKLK